MLILLPSLLAAFYAFGMAVIILSRNYKYRQNQVFALGLLSLFIVQMGNLMTLQAVFPIDVLFWRRIFLPAEALFAGNWLLFSLVFARSNYQEALGRWKTILISVYLVFLIFLAFTPSNQFYYLPVSSALFPEPMNIYLGKVGYLFYLFCLFTSVITLANLESTLKSSPVVKRRQIKFVILGVAGILAFSIYSNAQTILYSQLQLDYFPVQSLITLICLGMITFSIVRNKVHQIEIFVSREVVYHSLTFLLAGVYLLTVAILAYGLRYFGERSNLSLATLFVFLAILALVILLSSARLQHRLKTFIGKHFYKSKYDYGILWQEFTEKLGVRFSLEEMLSPIAEMVSETLGEARVGLWLHNPRRKMFYLAHTLGFYLKGDNSFKEDNDFIQYLMKIKRPITLEELHQTENMSSFWEKIRPCLKNIGGSVYVPLIVGDKMIGLMVLGEEMTRRGFDAEDCALSKSMATPIANYLLTAHLSQELIAAREKEAFSNLTLFILHDLKNFLSSLSLIAHNAALYWDDPDFKMDALNSITATIEEMKSLINKLSNVSNDKLNRRPANLANLISDTILEFDGTGEIKFLNTDNFLPPVDLDYEKIQKVLYNLILNAHEAISGKGEVTIKTEIQDGWVCCEVTDNGCGIPEEFIAHSLFVPFRTTKEGGLGIGLYQCKQIIDAHQGDIEVESQMGRGTTFRVKLPIHLAN